MARTRPPAAARPRAGRAAEPARAPAAADRADATFGAEADAFSDALTALLRLYMWRDRDRVCAHGLSVTECYALDALVRLGPLTVTGLAAELGVTKSTASRVAAALEARGLLERAPDPADYKATRLAPTAAGRARSAAVAAEVRAEHRALLADFTPAARREATRLLRAVTAAAAPRIRATGSACCDETAGR
jgi:DNA-binding MarR family transcriptional regulator